MKQLALTVSSLTTSVIEDIFTKAWQYECTGMVSNCSNKTVGMMLLEPSTNKSFEHAVDKLGAKVMHYDHASSSSVKGESFQDTVTTMSQYVDALVVRVCEPLHGTLEKIHCDVPMVNAGERHTQALLDLYTIRKYFPMKKGILHIAFVGDLKNGRTIHSTLQLLDAMYEGVFFHFVCEGDLKLDETYTRGLRNHFYYEHRLSDIIELMDVVYITRMQKERFAHDFVVDASCVHGLTPELVRRSKKSMIVLHPLPQNSELPPALNSSPHCKLLEQMKNKFYVQMALLEWALL